MLGFPHGTPIAGGGGLRPRAAGEVQRPRLPSEGLPRETGIFFGGVKRGAMVPSKNGDFIW